MPVIAASRKLGTLARLFILVGLRNHVVLSTFPVFIFIGPLICHVII